MALAEALVQSFFTTTPLAIGLARGGRELDPASGYRRARGTWALEGSTASAQGRFGPFLAPVVFDSVLLLAGDEVLREVPTDGPVSLPVAASWEEEVMVAVEG